ncbi:hypothetical protein QT971_11510 [Microcoleus sp. herbarium19]|uniref:hypothetical protein n=1 Tax=unclassified Microcoleus TaxID=2642155 RepID=UPI002FD75319
MLAKVGEGAAIGFGITAGCSTGGNGCIASGIGAGDSTTNGVGTTGSAIAVGAGDSTTKGVGTTGSTIADGIGDSTANGTDGIGSGAASGDSTANGTEGIGSGVARGDSTTSGTDGTGSGGDSVGEVAGESGLAERSDPQALEKFPGPHTSIAEAGGAAAR